MEEMRPSEYSVVLLALLPPAAAAAFVRGLWLADGSPLLYGYVAAGVAAGALLAPYLRTRPMLVRRLPAGLIAFCAAAFGLQFGDSEPLPAPVALAVTGTLAGLTLAATAVAALWIAGRYTIELRHRASVCLTSAGEHDFYQARCECGWRGARLPMTRDDDAETQAFADAAAHSPHVRPGIDLAA
ncbi:hypothetical protein ACQP00_34030 [Dactylosporangium sp. CS-047395]|uniref:hypothetical protein n=1 Tax=Dactylosporangium sp. CS-047395 TaxID=3239936 RepID=UPI003D8D7C51